MTPAMLPPSTALSLGGMGLVGMFALWKFARSTLPRDAPNS